MSLAASSLRGKVARRMFTVFLLCALLPFAGLVFTSYHQVGNYFDRKNQRQLRDLAKLLGMDVHERLTLLQANLQVVATIIQLSGVVPSEDDLDKLAGGYMERWHSLRMLRSDGTWIDIAGRAGGKPPESMPQIGKHRTPGKALISILPAAAAAPRLVMSVALDTSRARGTLLVGEINPSYLWGTAGSRLMPSYLEPCVRTQNAVSIMCSATTFASLPGGLVEQMKRGAVGEFEWKQDGYNYIASYWTVPMEYEFQTPGWSIILKTSREGAFASLADLQYTFLLGIVVSLGASLLLASFHIRKRLIPLEQLKQGTERIARQDFNSRIDVKSGDEFAELADSVNSMAEQLGGQFHMLEKANKAKDEFLAVISHELRTPLNVALGYLGILQDRTLGELNNEQTAAVLTIEKQSKHLLALVNNILTATLIEGNRIVIEKQPVELAEMLDELKYKYGEPLPKPVALLWDYSRDLPAISSDGEKLSRILENLIDNALKFTPGGAVTVSARYDAENDRVELAVADNGIGIAENCQNAIFEMFRQADNTETREFEGVGLGLFIAKRFAQLLGGDIGLASKVGQGSRFTVTLPLDGSDDKRRVVEAMRPLAAGR